MRFAIINNDAKCKNDELFFKTDISGAKVITEEIFWKKMYEEMVECGHEIHTVDLYDKYSPADFYLFLSPEWDWAYKLTRQGLGSRLVYCCSEPPTVVKYNTENGYKILKKIFPYILTTNRQWVDNINVFIRNIPYIFNYYDNTIPFSERKLITAISANKHSSYKGELYSERERAYSYFEQKCPEQFDFYGVLWENTSHPCYRGTVKSKKDTFQRYKFALCFENTSDIHDYVTEKIFDCICSGIVPIYAGAPNIMEYLSKDSFIDYFAFNSLDELDDYLVTMNEQQYNSYIAAGKEILSSDLPKRLSMEQYVANILDAVNHVAPYHHTLYADLWMMYRWGIKKIDHIGLIVRKKLRNYLKKTRNK